MDHATTTSPLVTVCFTCYNQRLYVERALRSVLGQTYDNLEIVISDDCSTDGTAEIVQTVVEEYRRNGGRHSVVVNLSKENGGVIRNVTRCFKLAHGELLVQAHDDDISFPDRVQRIVDVWLAADRKPTAVVHGWTVIDAHDNVIGEQDPWGKVGPWTEQERTFENLVSVWPLGAVSAYSADAVRKFPEMTVLDAYEDVILLNRARMLGDTLLIRDRLVAYRLGSGTSTVLTGNLREKQMKRGRRCALARNQALLDFESCKGKVPEEWLDLVREVVDEQSRQTDESSRFYAETRFPEKWKMIWGAKNLMMTNMPRRRYMAPFLLLPNAIGDRLIPVLMVIWYLGRRVKYWGRRIACKG